MKLKLLGLSALLILCLASTAYANNKKGQNASEDKVPATEAATAVSNNALAARLAHFARETKSPMAMAAAAEILAAFPLKDEAKAKTDARGTAAPSVSSKNAPDAQALFAEAVTMAKDKQNSALADIIGKQAKASGKTKGRVSGAARHIDVVKKGTKDSYMLRFKGGEMAIAAASSMNDEDIDMHVYDENGNLVASDIENDGVPVCIWNPRWTGEFKIRITNRASHDVTYILETN